MEGVETSDDLSGLELLCTETTEVLKKSYMDPVLLKDTRVLQNLLTAEDGYLPTSTYFSFQSEVKPFMRSEVAGWMSAVCCEQCRDTRVLPLAVNYMDRYLSAVNVRKGQLQLLGTVGMFIASKLAEANPLTAEDLVYYTNFSITVHDLLAWEKVVLQVLRWDLAAITPHDYTTQITSRLALEPPLADEVTKQAQHLADLCASDCRFIAVPPSMISSACIGAALCGVKSRVSLSRRTRLLLTICDMTHIEVDCLRACQDQIELLATPPASPRLTPPSHHDSGEDTHSLFPFPPDTQILKNNQPTTPTDILDIALSL